MTDQELFLQVRQHFDYDPETGVLTNLLPRGRRFANSRAGSLKRDGYRHINFGGKRYMEHRLIWFWVHGRWPNPLVDHINRIRSDNRICNLREATASQNQQNKARSETNPYPCVREVKSGRRFSSYAYVNRKQVHLGCFDSAESAYAAHLAFKSAAEVAA